jgi:hypothetical protein
MAEDGSDGRQFDIEACFLLSPPRSAACVMPAGTFLWPGALVALLATK